MELGSKNLSMKAFSFGIFQRQFRRRAEPPLPLIGKKKLAPV
jgi:hypothetical protein